MVYVPVHIKYNWYKLQYFSSIFFLFSNAKHVEWLLLLDRISVFRARSIETSANEQVHVLEGCWTR